MNEDLERFCHYCGEIKCSNEFKTKTMCIKCKKIRNNTYNKGLPLKDALIVPYNHKKKHRTTYKLSNKMKARICELFIGFNVPIKMIARIELVEISTVQRAIDSYLGKGEKPVLMTIG